MKSSTELHASFFRKHYVISTITIGIVLIVGIGLLGSGGSSSNSEASNNNEIQAAAPQTPAQQICVMTQQQLRSKSQIVGYKQLIKDPDSFQGVITKFTGQILQIEQNGDSGGVIRLSVTDLGDGIWSPNDVVYVEYNQATQAVQGDIVTVYGILNGTQTYTSEANYQITLPDLVACAVGGAPASASLNSATTGLTKQTTSTAVAPVSVHERSTPAVPTASWHTVATFSGSGDTNTNTFLIQGSQWKINWSFSFPPNNTSYCEQYGCNLAVQIFQNDGTYVDQFLESGQQPTSGANNEYGSTGTMYLRVIPGNVNWQLTVEDYY